MGIGAAALGLPQSARSEEKVIEGFEEAPVAPEASEGWKPVSDRRIRVGIAGYGLCHFGAAFGFQDHPNVEIVAVTDLIPDRCAGLAKACRCNKTYPSLEEMVKDDAIEAVFVATDPPSHARLCIEAMKHGKHVASAVPAVYGSLEDADALLETVKSTGLKYMMYETSSFHADLYAMRKIFDAGAFGKLVYSEGEYYHYLPKPLDSYNGWRVGSPPLWYLTHSSAYYVGVSGGSFTEVSCMGMRSELEYCQPGNNKYGNPFATEIALFRTSEGGMSRMLVAKDCPGAHGVRGRVRGEKGSFEGEYEGQVKKLPDTNRPPLPPTVKPGGHGGSHGQLTNEFITAILENRKPLVDIEAALNMTVPGIIAHKSAMADGELMKVPQYKL
ncbi:MAG: Gfo/Idh/MocA family oxidoreductase [Phycisphaerae bacterium]|nr:Gfo/Idh/MocA family oxidoreductase [Phycisphaerae bacterium]